MRFVEGEKGRRSEGERFPKLHKKKDALIDVRREIKQH